MSILLEALRKSENSQKPVEPPNIHRNDHPVDESGPINRSYVAVLVVIALAGKTFPNSPHGITPLVIRRQGFQYGPLVYRFIGIQVQGQNIIGSQSQ